jgi:glutamine amidotransferase
MSVAATDGQRIIAARYSSEHDSRSLYFSTAIAVLRERHPEVAELELVSDEARAVVSEPLGDLSGAWNPVPESAIGIVQAGEDELYEFTPRRPGDGSSPVRRRITSIGP